MTVADECRRMAELEMRLALHIEGKIPRGTYPQGHQNYVAFGHAAGARFRASAFKAMADELEDTGHD